MSRPTVPAIVLHYTQAPVRNDLCCQTHASGFFVVLRWPSLPSLLQKSKLLMCKELSAGRKPSRTTQTQFCTASFSSASSFEILCSSCSLSGELSRSKRTRYDSALFIRLSSSSAYNAPGCLITCDYALLLRGDVCEHAGPKIQGIRGFDARRWQRKRADGREVVILSKTRCIRHFR